MVVTANMLDLIWSQVLFCGHKMGIHAALVSRWEKQAERSGTASLGPHSTECWEFNRALLDFQILCFLSSMPHGLLEVDARWTGKQDHPVRRGGEGKTKQILSKLHNKATMDTRTRAEIHGPFLRAK